MTTTRRPRQAAATALAGVLLAGTTVLGGSGAGANPTSAVYAVLRPVCAQPVTPHQFRCFAIQRVRVAAGTPGATIVRAAGKGPAGGYTPRQITQAYHVNPNVDRSSITVGIVDWYDDPQVLADLNTFDAQYGLPAETATSFRKVNQRGRSAPLPSPQDHSSSAEIALDVQAVRGVCHTCRILLVEADAPVNGDLAQAENTAVRLGASVVTNSFGGSEQYIGPKLVHSFHHPGVVITASTGDDGWADFDLANLDRGTPASYPSSDPHVVAVGGTNLVLGGDNSVKREQVWNENPAGSSGEQGGAGGGGCSTRFPAPGWQSHVPGYVAARCNSKRLAADVSALADPVHGYDIQDSDNDGILEKKNGWLTIGGTSLSSPVVAALFALAGGSGGAAYPASTLYTNRTHRAATLFDVRHGANAYCGTLTISQCEGAAAGPLGLMSNNPNGSGRGLVDCSFTHDGSTVTKTPARNPECNALAGYDGPSGVGTPRSVRAFTPTNPTARITGPHAARAGTPVRFTARVHKRLRLTTLRLTWTWGDRTVSHSRSAFTVHTFRRAGTYDVALTVVDSRHQVTIKKRHILITK